MNPNQPTPDKLDKIIHIVCTEAIAALHPEGGEFPLDSRIIDDAKQAILQLYREWADKETARNLVRAKLRHKLQENQ